MKIVKTIQALRQHLAASRRRGKTIGFVPTMGYFHEGHLSLMRQAKKENDVVVVSLFVNPIQFGPKEDLAKYPRDLKRDAAMARSVGVDALFVPSVEEMYSEKILTYVEVGEIGEVLCGASRPGHFCGVATVVAKLLNIVQPESMYLGQKDAQQVAVLKKMVIDLNFSVKVRVGATVREPDGLAMSSRNIYLSPTERREAAVLSSALFYAKREVLRGELDAKKIISEIKKLLLEGTSATIEYISCISTTDLKPVRRIKGEILIALAVRFPSARLIDNVIVKRK
jgi:pantoate--beta-alanine ligase